jgi:hypothetical protein
MRLKIFSMLLPDCKLIPLCARETRDNFCRVPGLQKQFLAERDRNDMNLRHYLEILILPILSPAGLSSPENFVSR